VYAENPDLSHVRVGHDLEDMRQHMFAGIRLGMERLGLVTRLALVERRWIAFCRIRRQRRENVQQFPYTGAGLCRHEQDGNQVAFAQRFLERRMQGVGAGVGAVFEILGQQVFILLDDLVDQRPVGRSDRLEVGIAGIVLEHLDDIRRAMGGQVEQQALLAEALADIGDQAGQIKIVGIDLVDDDHPAQLALGSMAHHALGHQFDAGLRIDDDKRGIDAGQRGNGQPGEIRVTRRIDQMDMNAFVVKIHDRRGQRMTRFFLLGVTVADGAALLDAAPGLNRPGREQQRLGQTGLAGRAMADQRHGTQRLGGISGHLFLPELV
jgi:hypothetical protein